ncbi:cupin domain-containing protein [Caenimonas sp. SL110]|uniref:cupin domain-containing protein n=1 Tax=Caenimonas sp. SL110 TaxID=1450524 RepID=UPI0009E59C30
MIIKSDQTAATRDDRGAFGVVETLRLSEIGGLSQYGARVETLHPGARSSNNHWHENEDELVFVLSGSLTITEGSEEHVLQTGDAACWPAGVPIAHHASNRTDVPCTYLVVGTRARQDVCHYPDTGRTLHRDGNDWRLLDSDGKLFKSGAF